MEESKITKNIMGASQDEKILLFLIEYFLNFSNIQMHTLQKSLGLMHMHATYYKLHVKILFKIHQYHLASIKCIRSVNTVFSILPVKELRNEKKNAREERGIYTFHPCKDQHIVSTQQVIIK